MVVDAEGDGLDSNGTASMTGGTVVVAGPTNSGNGALDVNGDFTVDGGTLVAAGSAGMVVSPSADSKQGWVSATLDSAVEAGTVIQIVNADNEVIATYTTSKTVQNVVVSTADITSGDEYTVHTGGTASGDTTGGLSAGGELGSGTSVATVTAGEAAAGGMGGGRRPSLTDATLARPGRWTLPGGPAPAGAGPARRHGPTARAAGPARSRPRPPRSRTASTTGGPAG